MRKYLWGICYGLLLTAFTIYVLMDTFVISRVYTTVPPVESVQPAGDGAADGGRKTESTDRGETPAPSGQPSQIVTDTTYSDGRISITVTEYREHDTSIYVADVRLSDPAYLKTALAQGSFGRNVTEKTSEIAQRNGAILAINGDYYGSQERGYVLRNGVLYRDSVSRDQEDLVIYEDGTFSIITEGEVSASDLLSAGAQQILSFGPALVLDGAISVTEDEEVGKAKTSNPRTAIGVVDDLHYLLVVSDGRTEESEGLTLYELAQFMQSLGAVTAYNLDGGGSATMYFNGEVVNHPTTSGRNIKERSVSDIVYIGY